MQIKARASAVAELMTQEGARRDYTAPALSLSVFYSHSSLLAHHNTVEPSLLLNHFQDPCISSNWSLGLDRSAVL